MRHRELEGTVKLASRAVAGAVSVCLIVIGAAGAATAHVTVNPGEAPAGGFAKLDFRVPNEQDTAVTTKLEVQLPTDTPLVFVSVMPHPGWTYAIEKTKLATPIKQEGEEITEVVSKITWSGGTIKPGEFDDFSVSVGALPAKATSLTFKAIQTYDNGDVVRWIEEAAKGQPEPTHPAPVLTVVAGTSGGSDSSDGTARTLGIVGIVLGVVGAALGGLGWRRRQPAA
jgi:uncharacterized protein YcnI